GESWAVTEPVCHPQPKVKKGSTARQSNHLIDLIDLIGLRTRATFRPQVSVLQPQDPTYAELLQASRGLCYHIPRASKLGDRCPARGSASDEGGEAARRGRGKSELRRVPCSLTARVGGGCPVRAVRLRNGKCHRK